MIRVNLLPQDSGSKGKAKSASAGGSGNSSAITLLTILIALGTLGGSGYGFWWTFDQVSQRAAAVNKARNEVEKLEKDAKTRLAAYEALKERERQALNRGRVLLSLDPPDRILWAEKLNMLADLRPEGIAIIKLELVEDVKMVTSPESLKEMAAWEQAQKDAKSNKKSTQSSASSAAGDSAVVGGAKSKKKGGGTSGSTRPKEVKIPVVNQKLLVEGIAYRLNQSDRLKDINEFRDALERHFTTLEGNQIRRFMDGFKANIDRGDIAEIDNYQGSNRLVSKFSFTIEAIPMGDIDSDVLMKKLSEDLARRRRAAEALTPATAAPSTAATPASSN